MAACRVEAAAAVEVAAIRAAAPPPASPLTYSKPSDTVVLAPSGAEPGAMGLWADASLTQSLQAWLVRAGDLLRAGAGRPA